jgi:CD2 antigen cytoplasmic tail-binding protein 2
VLLINSRKIMNYETGDALSSRAIKKRSVSPTMDTIQKRKAPKNQGSSSKRVRFNEEKPTALSASEEFEFDHEAELETAKRRRGAVNLDGYGSSEDDSDDSEPTNKQDDADLDDMFADATPEDSKASSGKKKKTRFLSMNEIEGQEMGSRGHDSDSEGEGEPKVMAFNMKEELEEGAFDEEGNYVRNKVDPNAFHDKWLQGLSKKDIAKAKAAQEKQERAEQLKEADVLGNVPQDKTGIYRALVELLQPGEKVRDALVRLGGSTKKIPAWKAKKMQNKAVSEPTPEEIEKRQVIDRITALADQMMALGDFGIYDDTYESMLRHLRRSGTVPADWIPGEAAANSASRWEYRWAGSGETGEVYGPFSQQQMQDWQSQGFFANGIESRKVGSEDAFTTTPENFAF